MIKLTWSKSVKWSVWKSILSSVMEKLETWNLDSKWTSFKGFHWVLHLRRYCRQYLIITWPWQISLSLVTGATLIHANAFKSSSIFCFKYFAIINFSRKANALVVVDLLAGSCICTWSKLIQPKAPLAFFFLNYFLILKLTLNAWPKLFYKKVTPKTFGKFRKMCSGFFYAAEFCYHRF